MINHRMHSCIAGLVRSDIQFIKVALVSVFPLGTWEDFSIGKQFLGLKGILRIGRNPEGFFVKSVKICNMTQLLTSK